MSGIRYDGSITSSARDVPFGAAAPLFTMPFAQVTVYVYGTPPLTLATLFADEALTEPILNPIATDSEGRFGFWISPGVYSYTAKSANGVLLGNFNLTLTSPQGPVGTPATVAIGTVNTGAPGSPASVSNSGTASAAVFNFAIPQGPVGPTGVQGNTGATGAAGANGVASLPQLAALQTKQPIGQNLHNPATDVIGFYVNYLNGQLVALATEACTDFIVANAGGSMYTTLATTNSSTGCAFYDGNFTYISGFNTVVPAGGNFTVPSNAAYVRLSWAAAQLAAAQLIAPVMVGFGTVVPATPLAFGSYASNIIDAKDLSYVNITQAAVAAAFPAVRNLFDASKSVIGGWHLTTHSIDTTQTALYVSNYMSVIGGETYTIAFGTGGGASAVYGGSWYDANMKLISDIPASPAFTNGQQFVAPANASYFIIQSATSISSAATQMFVQGTVLPPSYVPFGASTPTPTPATYSTGKGRNVGMLGDSISAWFNNQWQSIVMARTGCNQTFQDSRGGRTWTAALECYGTITPGTPYASLLTYDPTRSIIDQTNFASNLTGRAPQISTLGNTLAQNLASTDILIIELGTNDWNYPPGALGDATTAGTLCGNMKWVIETYLTAKPTLRILGVSNEYRGDGATLAQQQAVVAALKTMYSSYGIPLLDLFNDGGASPFTNATYQLADHVHPSPFNFNEVYGPAIANFMQQWL